MVESKFFAIILIIWYRLYIQYEPDFETFEDTKAKLE